MKKLLALLIVCAALFFGYKYFKIPPSGIAVTAPVIDLQKARAALAADPIVGRLGADTMLYLQVNFNNFEPARDKFLMMREKLLATAAARKKGISEQFAVSSGVVWDTMMLSMLGAPEERSELAKTSLEVLARLWKDLKSASLIMSSQKLTGPKGLKFPYTLLSFEFSAGVQPEQIEKLIDEAVQKNSESLKSDKVIIQKQPGPPLAYRVELLPSNAGETPVKNLVVIGPTQVSVYIADDREEVFFPADRNTALVTSPVADALAYSHIDQAAVMMFFNGVAFGEYFAEMMNVLKEENQAAMDEAMNLIVQSHLPDINIVTYSTSLYGSIKTKQCLDIKRGSTIDKIYSKLSAGRGAFDVSKANATFMRYINSKTLFAWKFTGGALRGFASSVSANYANLTASYQKDGEKSASDAAVSDALSKLSSVGTKLDAYAADNDIDEIGVRIQSVETAPIPEVMLYASSESLGAADLLKGTREFVAALITDITQKPPAEGVFTEKDSAGGKTLDIVPFEGLTFSGSAAGDKAIKFTLVGPMLGQSSDVPGSDTPFLLTLPGTREFIGDAPVSWDTYSFLNTHGVFDSARTYLPFFLMGQQGPPDQMLQIGDIEEVLNIFKAYLLTTQSSYNLREGLYCFDSNATTLD